MNQEILNTPELSRLGWKLFPVHSIDENSNCTCGNNHKEEREKGKHPAISSWQTQATSDVAQLMVWNKEFPRHGYGAVCQASGFFVIDIDPRSGGLESFDKFDEEVGAGALPKTVMAYTGTYIHKGQAVRGRHIFYKVDADEQLIGNLKSMGLPGIDIKHNGYVVIAPTRHFSGVNYEWVEGHAPWEIEMAEAPETLLATIRKRRTKGSGLTLGESDWSKLSNAAEFHNKVDVQKILEEGIDEGSRAVDVYKLACALANKFGTSSDARMMIETMTIRFNHEKIRPPMELEGPNSLLMHTRRAIDFVAENPATSPVIANLDGPSALHDSAVSEWLAKPVGEKYCWTFNRDWLSFNSGYWQTCSREEVIEFIRQYLSDFWIRYKSEIHDPKSVTNVSSLLFKSRLKAFEELLRGLLEVSPENFDNQPDLLNVKNGVVDLRTGKLLPHNKNLWFTKIANVAYEPNAKHPDWVKALGAVPEENVEWLQAFLGQATTGYTPTEDILPVFSGGGRNGKTTLLQVILQVLGGFAVMVSDKVLTARPSEHSTDLTDLRGARFALLEEFPDRMPLNSKRLKDICGTTNITARRMRRDNETFKATHTMVITTNHQIIVDSGDDGTWRRLATIKFPYRYVTEPVGPLDKKVEANLRDRLYAGRQGQHEAVLAWLVEGAKRWYSRGKSLPRRTPQMERDLAEWRATQDTLGMYLSERLALNVNGVVAVSDLHADYIRQHPEDLLNNSQAAFTAALSTHAYFTSSGLAMQRKRLNAATLSRPQDKLNCSELKEQSNCLLGVVFK